MILIDTSAWIEFLRDTGSQTCTMVEDLLAYDIATCDPVSMELLAGARNEKHLQDLRGLLARATMIQALPVDFEEAAALYRECRRHGETVRKMIDCLIAAIALRAEVPLLHADADFDALARHTGLVIHSASA